MNTPCTVRPISIKEVMRITGKCYRQASRDLDEIRLVLNKKKKQVITVSEFCMHSGYDVKYVAAFLGLKPD